MSWTPQQQKAIELKGQNILVSAAAGSGKTAVLTERIARIVKEDGIPLKRILVVTFTEAAAAEMKGRIAQALEAVEEDSDFIGEQLRRIGSAKISTFHSFALTILKKHFHVIGHDPSFSICDDLRAKTLKEEALAETIAIAFSESDEFTEFFRNYAGPKDERPVQAMILKVYEFIMTLPNPFEWLDMVVTDLYENPSAFLSSNAMKVANEEIQCRIRSVKSLTEQIGVELTGGGFTSLASKNQIDIDQITAIESAFNSGDFEQTRSLLASYSKTRFASTKAERENGWDEIKELITQRRKRVGKAFADLLKSFYARDIKVYESEIEYVARYAKLLSKLVRSFTNIFGEIKRRENVVDFTDIEHLALAILKEDAIANDYKNNIDHIFIDEYQDSNYVQEELIKRVSRNNNVFMVGDVKQSIYKFRNAEPDIFLAKLKNYSINAEGETSGARIDLSANFRSKAGVIDAVNSVFEQVMDMQYCKLDYRDGQQLDMGSPCGNEMSRKARLYLMEKDSEKRAFKNIAEGEAFVCAKIINELIGQERFDVKENRLRQIEYRDIVILLRSAKKSAGIIMKSLDKYGIPAFTDRGDGYFETVEIDAFIGLLKTVINQRRDVPLATSLCSAAFGFNMTELADIRLGKKQGYFYEAFLNYAEMGDNPDLRDKCNAMIQRLAGWRNDERFMPLDEFLWKLMCESGHYDYVSALSNGEQRQANLRGLLDRARDFQKGRVRGLRAFVSYLERVKKDVAVPQVKHFSEDENVVRIMTIHGSKGLEFPVVIQCGMSRSFSEGGFGDDGVLLHKDIGMSLQWENRREHIYKKTLPHHAISLRREMDERAEYVRLLYVSMTRAMDLLCLVGTVAKPEEMLELYKNSEPSVDTDIMGANSYLDLIMPTVCSRKDLFEVVSLSSEDCTVEESAGVDEDAISLGVDAEKSRRMVAETINAMSGDHSEYVYPYESEVLAKAKYSVTELANRDRKARQVVFYSAGSREETDEDAGTVGWNLTAAEKGTALHKAFELLDFGEAYRHRGDSKFFEEYLNDLCKTGTLTDEEAAAISADVLLRFAESDLCKRAGASDFILKEVPFNMRLAEEGIIAQGVIDLLFKEDDGFVVADYKSGHFEEGKPGEEERICMTYGAQVSLYKKAASEIFNEPVKEALLYMTRAGVCIKV